MASGCVSLDEFHTAIEAAAPVKSLEAHVERFKTSNRTQKKATCEGMPARLSGFETEVGSSGLPIHAAGMLRVNQYTMEEGKAKTKRVA